MLVIRLDNLGDVLLITPAVRAIRESLPEARITLLTSPVGAQVGRMNPDIEDVIVHEAPWVDPWQKIPHDSARQQQLIALLKERAFDAAVIFTSYRQSSLPAALVCYLADIPRRLAASIDHAGTLLTTRYHHPEAVRHEVERSLALVGAVSLTTTNPDLVLQVPQAAIKKVEALLAASGIDRRQPLIVLHPGSSMPARMYPWQHYVEVIELLVARLGAAVMLTGVKDEQELIENIYRRLQPDTRAAVYPLVDTLPFEEFCALVQICQVIVTNHTGPMHVAAALKTPSVILFGQSHDVQQWGPWRAPHRVLYHAVPCRLCHAKTCPYEHDCLRLVTPGMVLEAAVEMLAQRGS